MLASFYSTWMEQLLAGPIPAETKATCDNCAMLPQPGSGPATISFHPQTKCCTFEPQLANYRVGLILSNDDPALAAGRLTVEQRLRARIAVNPCGIDVSVRFLLLYNNSPNGFGRAPDLGCPHQIEGRCGIWPYHPATCSTWFCKHDRGATGQEFWQALSALLNEVDRQLSLWCALEMGCDAAGLVTGDGAAAKVNPAELGAPVDEGRYGKLWGRWAGREAELYRGCAELVRPLGWDDVKRICGPRVTAMTSVVEQRFGTLTDPAVTADLRLGLIQIEGIAAGKVRVVTYSDYDPLQMPQELASALPHFDGRPVAEVLAELREKNNLGMSGALLQRLVDFRILVSD